jgi:hypothetical protein
MITARTPANWRGSKGDLAISPLVVSRVAYDRTEALVSPGKVRIEINRLLKEIPCESDVLGSQFIKMPQTGLIRRPGIEAIRRLVHRALLFGGSNSRSGRDCNRFGDLVLHRENIRELPVVAVGPDVIARFGFDQLCGDPDTIAGLSQAALEHIADAEIAPNAFHINRAASVGERGITSDNE